MTTPAPYAPTPFATPQVNPAIGGAGVPYPYVSTSQFGFAPTGVDVDDLVVGGNAAASVQALADTLRDASSIADQFVFGADAAAKGASLCATLSVEDAYVPVVNGTLRLVCDYKPIIQVNAVDIGLAMGSLSTIGATAAANIRIARRTLYVPLWGMSDSPGRVIGTRTGKFMVVWSYVNGYPHTQLAANITAGTNTMTVLPTDGGTGLFGIIPNQTQMWIRDGANTEPFMVSGVSGTTITSATNFLHNHTLPATPDFIPVTAVPSSVSRAVMFLTTALIKTEGDSALVLDEMREPKRLHQNVGDVMDDVKWARTLLQPFRVHTKSKV